ncbi:TonB-dependent receptor plug domain-containing protein [Aliikangiella maris]|uniref:TonB-dependent receptor n=2 Tax=Aliikangiella maris TaxID=3162458 RepID=A0ABV2BW33_9GAMM
MFSSNYFKNMSFEQFSKNKLSVTIATALLGGVSSSVIAQVSEQYRIVEHSFNEQALHAQSFKQPNSNDQILDVQNSDKQNTDPDNSDVSDDESQAIVIVGTRFVGRTIADSPVPVDLISATEISSVAGGGDLTDNMRTLVPSFNATPLTGDGSAFVRPTSLRGLSSDQTLVMINGKRRHRSALIQFDAPTFSSGAHSADIGLIPAIAIERVEVLRDGAAAQYGSDAIAGVINIRLKDNPQGGEVRAVYGQHFEGEQNYQLSGNFGVEFGEYGYFNFSGEYSDAEALSRGYQNTLAQQLIDEGAVGVGSDSPFDDAPLVQSWGRPEQKGLRSIFSGGYSLDNNKHEIYWHGNYADIEGIYRFFYREPGKSGVIDAFDSPSDEYPAFDFNSLFPVGFTPYLLGEQTDFSLVGGIDGSLSSRLNYDVSVGMGNNEITFNLFNSINPSLGAATPFDFYLGKQQQKEFMVNADFIYDLSTSVQLAFGTEWRKETFDILAGESASYIAGPYAAVGASIGSNGFPGFHPSSAGSFESQNYALYTDAEWEVSADWLIHGALRFEDYDDFDSEITWKFATRFSATDQLTLRGAVSTGFRTPTPGQANVAVINTSFNGTTGLQQDEGQVSPTSPLALANGGAPLTNETSFNISAGFNLALDNGLNIATDFYRIDLDNRIFKTFDIAVNDLAFDSISFFTNAVDTRTKGVDIIASKQNDWGEFSTYWTFGYNYTKTKIIEQHLVNGKNPVGETSVANIEENIPNHSFVTSIKVEYDKTDVLLRARYFGEHIDERALREEIDATTYIDIELNYKVNERFVVTLGAENVLDEFPSKITARESVGLPYPRRSAAGYNGGSFYLKSSMTF